MLMMVLMKVRILPKVINDLHDGGDDNDIDVRHLTCTLMRMTTKAMILTTLTSVCQGHDVWLIRGEFWPRARSLFAQSEKL